MNRSSPFYLLLFVIDYQELCKRIKLPKFKPLLLNLVFIFDLKTAKITFQFNHQPLATASLVYVSQAVPLRFTATKLPKKSAG